MGVLFVPDAFAEITITDDATGGDCASVGTWDSASRTCTFTSDLSETVVVGSNNITLDGNGHTIDSGDTSYSQACNSGTTHGITLSTKTNIVFKNLTIKNFCHAIYLSNSINNSILDNTFIGNYREAIISYDSSGDIISNNIFTDNGIDTDQYAIQLNGVARYSITGNTISTTGGQNAGSGIQAQGSLDGSGQAIIENNNISNVATGIMASGHYMSGVGNTWATIKNNVIDSSDYGIYCNSRCDVYGNTVTNNERTGITMGHTTQVHDNLISNNGHTGAKYGITWWDGPNVIYRNTISDNWHGLRESSSCDTAMISQNNIVDNIVQATAYCSQYDGIPSANWMGSLQTIPATTNGNYWSDYSPICTDANVDNICDDPYPFSSGTINVDDDYVWTVQDGWLSQITNPGNLSLGAADSSGAVGTFSAVTATHDGSSMSVTCDTASGTTFPIGDTTVTCTATNGIKTAFIVSVSLDSVSPTISVPSNITVVSPDNSGLAVTYDVTATDDFAVTTGPTCTPESGSTFAVGTTTVTCTAADAAGNVGTQTFAVTNNVEDVSPVVTVPADMIINLAQGETDSTAEFSVTATDNFAVTVGPTCTPESGSTFAVGDNTVTCTAADAAGNVGTGSFVVSIVEYDTTPPTVTVPSDITVYEIASNVGAVATFSVSATDNVAVTVDPTCSPISGATFSVGDNTVTCTAEDANGNVGTSTFIVTVVEYTPPSLASSNARVVDASGNPISEVSVNQQVQIAADVTNEQTTDQDLAYLVEVTGPATDEMSLVGSLYVGQSMTVAVPWTPPLAGDYILTIKVLDDMTSKNLLSTPIYLQINVPEPEELDLPTSVTVTNAFGSSTPGCEPNCFIPNPVTIAGGGEVTWVNNDNAAHTSTSGSVNSGPTGVFDSSLIMAGSQFSHTFNSAGVYPYFCMVHPWMTGTVLVGSSAELPDEPEPPAELSLSISKSEYNLNEIITVITSLDNISQSYQVTVEVSDPEGVPVVTRALAVSPNVSSSMNFKVSENSLTGNYKIVASVNVDGNTTTDTIYFKIKSQYNQFQIASVQVTDQQGNPSILTKGEMAYIKVTLTSGISIEPLVTVNLFDSDLTTLGVGSVRTNIGEGESEIILSFLIPDDAALGNADIFVNAFTNWVSSGGIPLTPEVSISEEITQ